MRRTAGRWWGPIFAVAVATAAMSCSDNSPTTQASVCERFDDLAEALRRANGIYDNPIFTRADRLAGVAVRFDREPAVQADGKVLQRIADSGSTTNLELEQATGNIAALCGAPPLRLSAAIGHQSDPGDTTAPTAPPVTKTETAPVRVEGSASGQLGVGDRVPLLRGVDFDDKPSTAPVEGKPTLVVFVAHWAPHSRALIDTLIDWGDTSPARGLELVAVVTGTSETLPNYPPSQWLEQQNWSGQVLVDADSSVAAKAYGVTGFPGIFAVDADGTLAATAAGELTAAQLDQLAAAVG